MKSNRLAKPTTRTAGTQTPLQMEGLRDRQVLAKKTN